jgi:alkyl sulfatase BDS1-like metallo-beta-lactamase superfamily hydrolase
MPGLASAGPYPARVSATLAGVLLQPAQAEAIIAKAGLKTNGDLAVLQTLASVMYAFNRHFNISTP